jgi:eukaryotic-like serine/threonine-protein kinase
MTDPYIDIDVIAETRLYAVKRVARVKDQGVFARKVLLAQTEANAARFQNEARILSRLNHPNIIRVIDQQLSEFPLYFVTPLYAQNLRQWLAGVSNLGARRDEACKKVFGHILSAVEYAHEQGVVHRDLKPENVLLNSIDDVVVIDFNISLARTEAPRYTLTGERLGTPHYFAPEQLKDAKQADVRSDVYSLGVILYELYGGAVGSSTLATEDLPDLIRAIVVKCCQQLPHLRYQTVSELKRAWILASDLNGKQSEINEIESLMLASTKGESGPVEAGRVLNLLNEYSENEDLLDRLMMESDLELLEAMAVHDPIIFDDVLKAWTEFFAQQSWPFDHTDKIAKRCEQLWKLVRHPGSRALIICGLILLGNKHNRYFVWRVAASLINATNEPKDVRTLKEFIFAMQESQLTSVCEYVDKLMMKQDLKVVLFRKANQRGHPLAGRCQVSV